ncbi:MAG TPA: CHAT domain-containing protein [Thermoanaerobaculia bacterium]|nr:CHAT domain-containing protein [Thermoanaerobaculia bacterium]
MPTTSEPILRSIKAVSARPGDAESLHVAGVTRLLLGRVEKAIELLEQASECDRADPAILNDLAVAHLERASREGDGIDLIDAFELADRSLRLNPTSEEAAFDRALAIERLGLRTEAIAAWRSVRVPTEWTAEAAEHIAHLSTPTRRALWDDLVGQFEGAAAKGDVNTVAAIVKLYPQEVRRHFEENLCGRWALAVWEGKSDEGDRLLRVLRTVAAALQSTTGNELPARTVAAIDQAKHSDYWKQLVRGHLVYQQAIRTYRDDAFTRAEPDFAESEKLLRETNSPFALLALFYRASSRSYENDITSCLRLLDQTERALLAAKLTRSPAYGNVLWVRGRSLLKRGLPHASLECFKSALAVFTPTGELESQAALHDLVAYNDQFLGEDDEAWKQSVMAVNLVENVGATRRERVILHGLADFSMNRRRTHTALLYSSALVRLSVAANDVGDQARALLDRGRAFHAAANWQAGDADLRLARALARQVSDRGMRDELYADLSAAEADSGTSSSPDIALARFDRAIDTATRVEKETLLPRLWAARARTARSLGLRQEAERSLRQGIAVIERHRWTMTDRDLQIAFAEQWYIAFDEMIDLLVDQGRYAEALSFAERSRLSVLFDQLNGARPPIEFSPMSARRIPEGDAVVEYAVLDNSIVVWVVRRDSLLCRRLPVGGSEIERLVATARASIDQYSDDDASARRDLGHLYDAIVGPVVSELRRAERLVIVPDKALQGVPFAALYDRQHQRWLIEDRIVAIAPSLNLFLTAITRDAALACEQQERILTLGDPAFDRRRFPMLPRLDAANAEARRIARLYPKAVVLTGSEATPSRLKKEAQGCPIVHLATHAISNPRLPSWSALLLAPEPDTLATGVLYAHDIDRRTFSRTRLVVLAGCETASAMRTRYEGSLGLARSFLAAGVPSVVSTLWRIDDETSQNLLLRFHQRLRAGDDSPNALRAAQLDQLHSSDKALRRVATWAGFQVIGGVFRVCPSHTTKGAG